MKTTCPNCGGKLTVNRLMCTDCQAEYPIKEALSPYNFLNDSQAAFLEVFLKSRGNLKSVGETLHMSYPTVKKNFDDLLLTLGYMEENKYEGNFDMNILENMNYTDSNISDIIKRKIYETGGTVTISLLDGKPCHIAASNDGRTFTSDKLNHYSIKLDFEIFDSIIELLRNSKNYKAPKGNAHGKEDKVGYGKCTLDTVIGTIAIKYFHKNIGESTLDPVFVLAAILDWAGIAKNLRGYIQLNPEYF